MTDATLERDGTTITLPLVDEPGANSVATDHGKPNMLQHESGTLNPRIADFWNGVEGYNLRGRFTGTNAYTDAISLADEIKSHHGGSDRILNINMPEYDSDMLVAPPPQQERALTLTYNPGRKNYVEYDLRLTRYSNLIGSGTQEASTPTASGTGPIQITDGTTTVDMKPDVTVQRTIGRHNSDVNRKSASDLPIYIDHLKAAYDAFEISFRGINNADTIVNDVLSITKAPLGRDPLTLDFNGIFGMGSFDVAPQGSDAVRHTRLTGRANSTRFPSLNFRVVRS